MLLLQIEFWWLSTEKQTGTNYSVVTLKIFVWWGLFKSHMKEDIGGGVSMEMENGGGLVEKVGGDRVGHHVVVDKVGYVRRRVIVKRRKNNNNNNKPYIRVNKRAVSNKVIPKTLQELFVSCRETFKGPGTVPSSQDVHRLCHILGMINSFGFFLFFFSFFSQKFDMLAWIR